MAGDNPHFSLLRAPPEDALQEWIVSSRVNRSGVGDDDQALDRTSTASRIGAAL